MRKWVALCVLVAVALVAAGCGSSKKKSSAGAPSTSPSNAPYGQTTPSKPTTAGGSKVKLKADPDGSLYFEPKGAQKAKAGTVTLVMTNPATTKKMHGIAIEGNGIDKTGQIVSPGSTSTLPVSLKPGKYTFYCPVDGHRQKGMHGTLVVK